MRFFRVFAASLIVLLAASAFAQVNHTTTVTLSDLLSGGGSSGPTPMPYAQVCAMAVNQVLNPVTVTSTSWGLLPAGKKLCASVTNGALGTGLPVPDAYHTNSAVPIEYNFSIQQTDAGGNPIGQPISINGVIGVTGVTFALDSYSPPTTAVSPSPIIGYGSNVPVSCTSPSIWTTPTDALVCQAGVYVSFSGNGNSGGFSFLNSYSSLTSYALGAVVTSGSSTYISLQASNFNNPPASSPTYWSPFADAPNAAATAATAAQSAAVTTATAHTVNGKSIATNPSLNALDTGAVLGVAAGSSNYPVGSTSGTINVIQSRIPFVPPANTDCIQVAWATVSTLTETGGPQFTMRSAIEYPAGTFYPLFFSGRRDVTVDPKGIPVSDPVCIDTGAGKVLYVRTLMQKTNLADTTAYPINWTTGYLNGATKLAPNTTDATGQFDGAEALKVVTNSDGAVTAGSGAFTSASAPFSAQFVGQSISIAGAGTYASCAAFTGTGVGSGSLYCGTISAYSSTSAVTISPNATTTVSAASYTLAPTDKTTSGTIFYSANVNVLGPIALLGQTAAPVKSAGLVGDSISQGVGAALTGATTGSWAVQALSQTGYAAGKATIVVPGISFIQSSQPGETCANLSVNHATRFAMLGRTKKILGMLGTNDIFLAGSSASTVEACLLTLWQQESVRGSAPYYGTIVPQTTSTDNWLTSTNQTVTAQESNRLAVNAWLRDGAPEDCSTGLPAATGSTSTTVVRTNYYSNGALTTAALAGASATCNHPALAGGTFELADAVEVNSSGTLTRNGGFWAVDPGARILTGCSATAGSAPVTLTCTSGTFTSADSGRLFALSGSGITGTSLAVLTYVSSTSATMNVTLGTTISGATLTVDGAVVSNTAGRSNNGDGIHPNMHGHYSMGGMAAAAPVALWTF